jgi:hypothetical protein
VKTIASGEIGFDRPREPEVADVRIARRVQQDVLRLQIHVIHAVRVEHHHRDRRPVDDDKVLRVVTPGLRAARALRLERRAERAARHKLGDQRGRLARLVAHRDEPDEREQRRVPQRGDAPDLRLELAGLRVVTEDVGQRLDGDVRRFARRRRGKRARGSRAAGSPTVAQSDRRPAKKVSQYCPSNG